VGIVEATFFADLGAGLTVGLIALPLAIGFGIASEATPQQGLWTGIIASIVVALLGGSRFQVAGPTLDKLSRSAGRQRCVRC
jgi:SulP family sulfate permease